MALHPAVSRNPKFRAQESVVVSSDKQDFAHMRNSENAVQYLFA
jgi:hypothetical protein